MLKIFQSVQEEKTEKFLWDRYLIERPQGTTFGQYKKQLIKQGQVLAEGNAKTNEEILKEMAEAEERFKRKGG